MALYYITGISGSGKTTIRNELTKRGYLAYDGDDDGITSWRVKLTGKLASQPAEAYERTQEWYGLHDWNMSKGYIRRLSQEAQTKSVFVCGTASNRYELWNLFTKVFCLTISQNTLKDRLSKRTNNPFGKATDELANILSWHKSSERDDQAAGAIMVNADRPMKQIVDEILNLVS